MAVRFLFFHHLLEVDFMLSKEEIQRYKRQVLLPEIGESGQVLLKNSKVLIVGAGGLGNSVSAYLAAAGVGEITIVDHDVIEESNLQRQVMFSKLDIGKSKSEVLVEKLQQLNEHGTYFSINQKFNLDNSIKIVENKDVIIDCVDQIEVRYLMNDVSVLNNIPLIYGAIHRFEGQVSVFNLKGSASYRCAFPKPEIPKKSVNCEEAGVIGVLPGIIGMYQAMEVIKLITGIGTPLTNQILMINLLNNTHLKMGYERVDEQIAIARNRWNSSSTEENILELEWRNLKNFIQNNPNTVLVDLQEDLVHEQIHGVNVKHIPDYIFVDEIKKMDLHETIVVYCKRGVKSLWAMEVMKSLGFKNRYQISGGLASEID